MIGSRPLNPEAGAPVQLATPQHLGKHVSAMFSSRLISPGSVGQVDGLTESYSWLSFR